jgi:hypothetical protein
MPFNVIGKQEQSNFKTIFLNDKRMLPKDQEISKAQHTRSAKSWLHENSTCIRNWSKRQDLAMLLDQIPVEKPITRILIAGHCSAQMLEHIRRRFPHARVCWLQEAPIGNPQRFGDMLYTFQGSPDELPRSSTFHLVFRFHFSPLYPFSALYPFVEEGGYLLLRQKNELIKKSNTLGYTGVKEADVELGPKEQLEETLHKHCAEVMYSGPNPSWPARLSFVIRRNTRKYSLISWAGVFVTELLDGLDEMLRQSVSHYQDRLVRKPSIYRS